MRSISLDEKGTCAPLDSIGWSHWNLGIERSLHPQCHPIFSTLHGRREFCSPCGKVQVVLSLDRHVGDHDRHDLAAVCAKHLHTLCPEGTLDTSQAQLYHVVSCMPEGCLTCRSDLAALGGRRCTAERRLRLAHGTHQSLPSHECPRYPAPPRVHVTFASWTSPSLCSTLNACAHTSSCGNKLSVKGIMNQ